MLNFLEAAYVSAIHFTFAHMKWKHIMAVICLLVLGTQVLPVKQLGLLLSSNTINEELPHSVDDGKDISKEDFAKKKLILPASFELSASFSYITRQYIHFSVSLPDSHAGDIPTPPPNIA